MGIAIKDGVDILSMSIGRFSGGFSSDQIAIGAFRAIHRGVLVCCSAGNSGPSPRTLVNDAPWILTVGASTIDRNLEVDIVLPSEVITGEAIFQPMNFPSRPLPLVYIERGDRFWDSILYVKGKIGLFQCHGKTRKSDVAKAIADAGGVAIIYINSEEEGLINSDLSVIPLPSAQISYADGLKIIAYINSTSAAPQGTLLFRGTIIGDTQAPIVASFSSRGPSLVSHGILKPDIIAPGSKILGAWPWPVSIEGRKATKSTFNILSGTSMACPHISGVAALVKSLHPNWSPAAIKSAIMTTANVLNLASTPIEDQTLEAANVFATGSGHVDPSRAIDPGLIYEIEPEDYIAYLYGLGYTYSEVVGITGLEYSQVCNIGAVAASELNYPSFLVLFGHEVQTHTRTLTNVGEANSFYTVEICSPPGVHVAVQPSKLCFREKNQKISYAITFTRLPSVASVKFTQGSLTWKSTRHLVRSPIVAIMLN